MDNTELFTIIQNDDNPNGRHLVPTSKFIDFIRELITDEDIQYIVKLTAFNSRLKKTEVNWADHRILPSIRYDADSDKATLIGASFILGSITVTYGEKPFCLRMSIYMNSIVEQCLNYSLVKFGPEDGANHIEDAIKCIIVYCAAFAKTLSLALMNKEDDSDDYLKIASDHAIKMVYDRLDVFKSYGIDIRYFIEEIVRPVPDSFPPFMIWS